MTVEKCPECGQEQNDVVQSCANCGFMFENNQQTTNKIKHKIYAGIIISIFLIIIAVLLVTTKKFVYCINNISYYSKQYEETRMQSDGFLGGTYASLALQWKEMRDMAVMYVVSHSMGMVVLISGGCVGLYCGLKKLKVLGRNQ